MNTKMLKSAIARRFFSETLFYSDSAIAAQLMQHALAGGGTAGRHAIKSTRQQSDSRYNS